MILCLGLGDSKGGGYQMTKTTIKPYYKYKREAYNKIQDVARLFLKENDFFIRTGLPQDITITLEET